MRIAPIYNEVDGFGPIGHKYRTSEEFILHDSIVDRAALLALVIFKCASEKI